MRISALLLLPLAAAPLFAQGRSNVLGNPPPLKIFQDTFHEVSFQYPSVWKIVRQANSFSPPFLSAKRDAPHPVAVVQFSPQAVYAKTNLEALIFTYFRRKVDSAETCRKFGELEGEQQRVNTPQIINGVSYQVNEASLGSAGHGIDATSYVTYRDGICYAFEADFDTVNALDDARRLTASETRALQHHLDAVMQTVRLGSPAAP